MQREEPVAPTRELALTAIKQPFTSAAGASMNVSELWDSGQSHWDPVMPRCERPVPADAADLY